MIATIALTVAGSWTYGGFLAEPSPTPGPEPTPPPASAPVVPAPEAKAKPAVASRPEPPALPQPPATKPAASSPPIPPSPTSYRLSDASGQSWEHHDPAYLSSFVEARNRSTASYYQASPATYTYTSALQYRASRCAGGRCN